MTHDDAYALMQVAVEASIVTLEDYAKTAKNPAARKRLIEHVERLRRALAVAKKV